MTSHIFTSTINSLLLSCFFLISLPRILFNIIKVSLNFFEFFSLRLKRRFLCGCSSFQNSLLRTFEFFSHLLFEMSFYFAFDSHLRVDFRFDCVLIFI
jgi:hypothetical protein